MKPLPPLLLKLKPSRRESRLRGRSPAEARILQGHLWAYRSEIAGLEKAKPGEMADLCDSYGRWVGRGYANPLSEISFRLLTREERTIDTAFFREKIEAALNLREREKLLGTHFKTLGPIDSPKIPPPLRGGGGGEGDLGATLSLALSPRGRGEQMTEDGIRPEPGRFRTRQTVIERGFERVSGDEPCRLVYSEGDLLPGFIVDFYPPVLVVSFGTAGAENLRKEFLEALETFFPENPVYARSDSPSRLKEGLKLSSGPLKGEAGTKAEVLFDGIPVKIDFAKGQKTGAFLDAREMRRHLRDHSSGCSVLDCFAHIGLFSRYADAGGASEITAVETDKSAADEIRSSLPKATVLTGNAFDILRKFDEAKKCFDRIVLDPPAFTRDARSVTQAARGYKEINLRAMRLLKTGGLLYTSSCSYHLSREMFVDILRTAASDAGASMRIVRSFAAAPDHPVLLEVPETDYFKGFVLEKK